MRRPATPPAKPTMATRSTAQVLAYYDLTNPHDNLKAFLGAAAALADRLRLKAVKVVAEGKSTLHGYAYSYKVAAEDQWAQPIASAGDNAADVLAQIARENASRYGRAQRGEWPPKS